MCGIVAQFNFDKSLISPERIEAMMADIQHRGPDDKGTLYGDWFGLGFRRLAILDMTKHAHQPMVSLDGRYVLVYNGEIYNYIELRDELKAEGYQFESTGDTEVLLNAFIHWGAKCLDRLNGMFAFIVVDLQTREAFIARDPIGIKPLYYTQRKNSLYFASEIKAFRHVGEFRVNQDALYEQFVFRYVSGRQTLFENVFRVFPGTYSWINCHGGIKEHRYCDIIEGFANSSKILDVEVIETAISESVHHHTRSDVGYNVQLSGGVDSSYITALLATQQDNKPHTFSVTLDAEWDESSYQQQVVERYSLPHHSFCFDNRDLANAYIRATWHLDMPIVHVACPLLMLLCDQSRDNSKVILTGEGADELFLGYSRYLLHPLHKLTYRLNRMGVSPTVIPPIWKLRSVRKALQRNPALDLQRGFRFEWSDQIFQVAPGIEIHLDFREELSNHYKNILSCLVASDQLIYLQSLLERQDRMSMAASVEARVPFCTRKLFLLLNKVDNHKKLHNNTTKVILKKLAERFYPKPFVHRPKEGFRLPLAEWLRAKDGMAEYLDLLCDQSFRERGIFDAAVVKQLIDQHRSGKRNWAKELFVLINFEIWYRLFIEESLSISSSNSSSS